MTWKFTTNYHTSSIQELRLFINARQIRVREFGAVQVIKIMHLYKEILNNIT